MKRYKLSHTDDVLGFMYTGVSIETEEILTQFADRFDMDLETLFSELRKDDWKIELLPEE